MPVVGVPSLAQQWNLSAKKLAVVFIIFWGSGAANKLRPFFTSPTGCFTRPHINAFVFNVHGIAN